jgi:hypothetical protein
MGRHQVAERLGGQSFAQAEPRFRGHSGAFGELFSPQVVGH